MKILMINNYSEMNFTNKADETLIMNISKIVSILEKTLPLKKFNKENSKCNTIN